MASNKMMTATAQALSTRSDYSFHETMTIINEYFDLGLQEYNVFTFIAGLSELCQGVSFPSQSKIAEKLNVDRTRANKIVAQLVEKGVLIVVKVEGIRNNFYIIPTIAELMSKVSEKIQAITSKVKDVIKKTAEKAQEVAKKVSNVIAPKKERKAQKSDYKPQNGGRKWGKKPIRTEMIPDHMREDFVAPAPQTTATKESILARLRSAGY
ncbi:hypothetical protein ABE288_22500 [Bacillus salipaludis]|uniref:hypothetical protein n=1 Tax=Bacillus salipaludis TaxID=2547811 RepID=UPI003D24A42E